MHSSYSEYIAVMWWSPPSISGTVSSPTKFNLPLNNDSISPLPAPGSHHPTSCLYECHSFRAFVWVG